MLGERLSWPHNSFIISNFKYSNFSCRQKVNDFRNHEGIKKSLYLMRRVVDLQHGKVD